jgi:class 3 adenylate cyclase
VTETNSVAKGIASAATDKGLVRRLELICYALAFAHFSFGFTSLAFLQKFDSSITWFGNFLPRFLLNAIPFLLLGYVVLRNKKWPVDRRVQVYIWTYAFLFFVAAWIHVWPLALKGHPDIFFYVAGVNTAYLCSTWSVAAIPRRFLFHIVASLSMFIVVPVVTVAYFSGDPVVLQVVTVDSAFAMVVGVGLGLMGSNVFWQLELLRAENEVEASKYLGEPLRRAIYQKKTQALEEKICSAYVLMVDIRESSRLTRELGDEWSAFNKEWLRKANDAVKAFGGTFVKSTGDGLLAAFGLFDEEDLVSDIPGAEVQNKIADEERWLGLTVNTYGCVEVLFRVFHETAKKYFPERNVRMACGLDRGDVRRGIRGGRDRQEFDIWGDKVNTAAKLEAYSKVVSEKFDENASLLVVSPYAADFLDALNGFTKVDVSEGLRSGLYGVRWVLVREYGLKTGSLRKSA